MSKFLIQGLLVMVTSFLLLQGCGSSSKTISVTNEDEIINAKEVERIERILASDYMQGRRVFTPGIDKAADFIASEFKAAGLETWKNSSHYRQEFVMARPKHISTSGSFDGIAVSEKNTMVITTLPEMKADKGSGYELASIKTGGNLLREASVHVRSGKNRLVIVDTSFGKSFASLSNLRRNMFKSDKSVIFLLALAAPRTYSIESKHEITESKLSNVVAVLPGKSKKDEYVVFSAHYDHLGIGKPVNGDSIYNGANDDAAGTTAVIALAKYFRALGNNERTLVFAAFTAEESGGYGSQYFSRQFDPGHVMAMFNIEMIGTESKWGKNSAYITGYEKTDMGAIMQKNLEGTGFSFHPDPYPDQNLFYRSDNATLARLGVPAHTISTAKMEGEPHYHKVSDHIETLDMENMAMIIKSIALSAKSIVNGKDTPARVKVEELK